jgi:hypothetical protein
VTAVLVAAALAAFAVRRLLELRRESRKETPTPPDGIAPRDADRG